jgi:hypothetical protein
MRRPMGLSAAMTRSAMPRVVARGHVVHVTHAKRARSDVWRMVTLMTHRAGIIGASFFLH